MKNHNRRSRAILSTGSDQIQPIELRKPAEPLPELSAALNKHLAARPPNHDILALTTWVEERDRLSFLIELAS